MDVELITALADEGVLGLIVAYFLYRDYTFTKSLITQITELKDIIASQNRLTAIFEDILSQSKTREDLLLTHITKDTPNAK